MPVHIQLRRDTAANWAANNPTLAEGELGIELDTGKFKIGTGSDNWTTLSYAAIGTLNHSVLENLDYDTSGHTNFQKLLTYEAAYKAFLVPY